MGFTLKVQFKKTGLMSGASAPSHSSSFSGSLPSSSLSHPYLPSLSCPAALSCSPQSSGAATATALAATAANTPGAETRGSAPNYPTFNTEPISPASFEAFVAPPSQPSLDELQQLVAAKLKQVSYWCCCCRCGGSSQNFLFGWKGKEILQTLTLLLVHCAADLAAGFEGGPRVCSAF